MKNLLILALAFVAAPALAQNLAKVEQTGDDNEGVIAQSGGTDNFAYILQDGGLNEGAITQIGNGNDANSETVPGLRIIGNENHTDIYQEGDENYARIRLTGDRNGDVNGNAVLVEQIGFRHRGQLFFIGDDNRGFVDQTAGGQYDYVYFSVGGSNGFAGRPEITANSNTVEFTQSGEATTTGFLAGDGNQIYVHQTGPNNIGDRSETAFNGINVYGNDNLIEVDQTMSGNNATVTIDGLAYGDLGNNNVVDIDQHLVGGLATVDINGSGNHATILQN